jgi:hypothetical protein
MYDLLNMDRTLLDDEENEYDTCGHTTPWVNVIMRKVIVNMDRKRCRRRNTYTYNCFQLPILLSDIILPLESN